jgi:hypothetical protein
MPRYFFHIQEDESSLDDEGIELDDAEAARQEALRTSGGILRDGDSARLWSGRPWRLWVTDQPRGLGNTLFTIEILATEENVADLPAQRP